jgi:hypothetical protein
MTFRTTACCAALLMSLSALAAQAAPCDGDACPSAAPAKAGKPLQLGQFMRTAAKPARHAVKPSTQTGHRPDQASKPLTQAIKTHSGKPKKSLALRKRIAPTDEAATPLATEAAAAFAAQDTPDVRVVAADELNDIDLAAGPAAPETVGLAPSGAQAVVDATFNDIDHAGDQASSLASAADPVGEATQPDRASATWIEQFSAMLQHMVAALVAGWRALFG